MTDPVPCILLVDDEPRNLRILEGILAPLPYALRQAGNGQEALEQVATELPDLVLLDVVMPGLSGFEVCTRLKSQPETRFIPVVLVTALAERESKITGIEAGADDFINKPVDPQELRVRVQSLLRVKRLHDELQQKTVALKASNRQVREANEHLEQRVADRTAELKTALEEVERLKNRLQQENVYLQQEIQRSHNFKEIITRSQTLHRTLAEVEQVAATDATVLILGETGTGKELLARAVHSHSRRKDRPLVKVNCAALPANLIESELFGHEKGAFTGALARQSGRFELADGGTIFLDEIGDLPRELQGKLLRVLQDGEFERLGSAETLGVDVRVIAATNRDLEEAVAKGDFRDDLFYRLNVFPIRCPPLRERKEDIPLLVEHFVGKYSTQTGKRIEAVSQKGMDALRTYDWPGNVRELENIVERAVIVSRGTQLELGDWLTRPLPSSRTPSILTLEEMEREHILKVLEQTGWRVRGEGGAAQRLGIKPTTLEARMKKLEIGRRR